MSSFLKRYGLLVCAAMYTGALVALHALGHFPAPGLHDISRLAGSPVVTLKGRVVSFPQTRWGKTRFVLEGRADPLSGFRGKVLVTLDFPLGDLAPEEILRLRGWLSTTRPPGGRRTFDERAYGAGRGAFAVLRVWSAKGLERLDQDRGHTWTQSAWRFHQQIKQFWFTHLPYEEAAVLSCMTMGSRGILPLEIKERCVRAGVYHILVVSGQNVALIIALAVGGLNLLQVPRRWTFLIGCLPILFYAAAVGADPPVTRAAAMAIVALGATAIGRDIPGTHPFALAWLWVLMNEPAALFGASFQLSFGATASLLVSLSWLRPFWMFQRRIVRWIAEAGTVSLAVQAGIGPILVYYFQRLSLAGFLANWLLVPFSGGVMVVGLVVGTWGVWSPDTVPQWVFSFMHAVLQGMLQAIARISAWEWAMLSVPAPSWIACGIYYGLLICILVKLKHAKKSTVL